MPLEQRPDVRPARVIDCDLTWDGHRRSLGGQRPGHVAPLLAEDGDEIVTSDPKDLALLAARADLHVDVVPA